MKDFKDKIAVVTGGGTGMGRELVLQLAEEGCHVAMCDVIAENMEETFELVTKQTPDVLVTKHICDVSDEEQVLDLRMKFYRNKKLKQSIFFLIMPE